MTINERIAKIAGTICVLGVLLTGCGQSHAPLSGVYYGYYVGSNDRQFVILAFDPAHPTQVAIRKTLRQY